MNFNVCSHPYGFELHTVWWGDGPDAVCHQWAECVDCHEARAATEADTTEESGVRIYPYLDGDVTVLGPECFIDVTKTVISYKGVNYARVEEHTDGD